MVCLVLATPTPCEKSKFGNTVNLYSIPFHTHTAIIHSMSKLTPQERSEANKRAYAERQLLAAPKVKHKVTRESRINELRDSLLSNDNGRQLLAKVISIALNDEHPGQMAALKLTIDRILPQSAFEAAKNEQRTAIQINISMLDTPTHISHAKGTINV